ncbi:SDR family oxidoreductase [Nocardia sp. NPDC050697]|uniref:SDR family oxidoreductase n=1 Tax=Nocardia sp. NPDC050697 TaxID=3155158 RepID=UPI00340A4FE5
MLTSSDTVLLTGVTGFVGGALAVELLCGTDAELVCLIRSRGAATSADRLRAALRASAAMYGIELTGEQLSRCRAVTGDITAPTGGVEPGELRGITEVWHAAASLAFEDVRADEITLHNEQGTANIVDLAHKADCGVFTYVSTAYVAGRRRGRVAETAVPEPPMPNNHYERTKIAAERIVAGAGFDTTRVFRPSIVIGHSRTRVATTFSGLYGFIQGLQRTRATVRRSLGDLLNFRPLRLLADGQTPVNFIPVDLVASAAVRIAARGAGSGIYHLANSTPPRLADCWDSATTALGMMRPIFVDDVGDFTLVDQKLDDQLDFYRPYLNDEKHFDVTNSEAVLGAGALSCPLSADEMSRYVEWFIEYQKSAMETPS